MCGINNWRSLCILPDTGGRTFARVKHGKIGIRNLLFPAIGGIPRGGRLLGCSRGLRRSGSAFPGRRFALGHFVPRLRLGLVGAALSALAGRPLRGLAASFALSACLPLSGAAAFFGGLPFVAPSRAAVKSTTFPVGTESPIPGIVVCFSSPYPVVYPL